MRAVPVKKRRCAFNSAQQCRIWAIHPEGSIARRLNGIRHPEATLDRPAVFRTWEFMPAARISSYHLVREVSALCVLNVASNWCGPLLTIANGLDGLLMLSA
jgi:hypothetical protein